ncbi:MAG: autotransporter outer membrane beta-barrel domain-containing protein, partial [Verrucomicrobiales bacterium]|nr:autotransporter outer membrane beta-barrel domain-containing protein [Verrucomicrobiales bacterium]
MNPKLTLLTLCALSVCFAAKRLGIRASVYLLAYFTALNVLAQNFVVTSDTTVSGTHYENKSTGTAALTNPGAWTFTGSDVTLTGAADSGNGRDGARFTAGGTLNFSSGTINANRYAIYLSNTSVAVVDDTIITTSADSGYGIDVTSSSTLTLTGGIITTTGSAARGIYVSQQSTATVTDATIATHGDNAAGLYAVGTSALTVNGGSVTTTGTNAHGFYVGTQATVTATNAVISTNNDNSHGAYVVSNGTLTLTGGTITTTGSAARGIYMNQQATVTATDVTIATQGDNAAGIYATGTSTLTMNGGTITTTGSESQGIYASGSLFQLTVTNMDIITHGDAARGIYDNRTSEFIAEDLRITTYGVGSIGIGINGAVREDDTEPVSSITINRTTIETHNASGIASGGADIMMTLSDVDVHTTGSDARALALSTGSTGHNKTVILNRVNFNAEQGAGVSINKDNNLYSVEALLAHTTDETYNLTVNDSTISGIVSIDIYCYRSGTTEDGEVVVINMPVDSTITANNSDFTGDLIQTGSSIHSEVNFNADSTLTGNIITGSHAALTVTLNDSTVTGDAITQDDSALALSGSNGAIIIGNLTANADSTIALTLTGSDTTLTGDLTGNSDSTLEVTINDGGTITGDFIANDNSSLNLGISEDSTVIGNITGSGSSTLAVTVHEGGVLTGNITTSDDNITTVNISDGGTITGDLTASGNSDLTLDLSENGTVSGNITGTGSSTLDITVSDSGTLAGSITTSEDNITTVNISDGGAIIGDLTGSDNSTLAVTVGDGGTLTGALNGDQVTVTVDSGGNVTINQDSDFNSLANNGNVTVDTGSVIITNPITGNGTTTVNDSGNLTASFDSGNGSLVINPGGGVNLTQDSNLGTISNDGALNVGDYQVSVSDLANNGTIAIAVNTDSGAHGTLHVTGTSSGAGTIHVNSTGDGQANPNDVLGNLVTGNGTANYTWDEVDWGLEELIVTPNPDGTITVKEDGTSPAGAVLNSAIAVQQSMWFAQQNSLLKRMGELRYGARASRPPADKDVRVPYHSLIENIWLRSYGQQLNVGSQVSGKAYEQLIYGVDLGTDHKFTISADSDLYLGVYAGYGRSDLDYRTPGADGEINSYYGGLYATWLHSSGFYIDATIKAASVDNNLKAPHGDTQLKANYSDINLGGSLELGKKFTFADAWFIEPQFQVNYLHILAEDYTAGPMTISA